MVVYLVLIGEDIHVYPPTEKVSAHVLHAMGADLWRMDSDVWERERSDLVAMGARVTDHRTETVSE
jgi:hypothetical protein